MTHCRLGKHGREAQRNIKQTSSIHYVLSLVIMLSLRLDSNNSTAISSNWKGRHEVDQTEIKVRIADAFSFPMSLKQQTLSRT